MEPSSVPGLAYGGTAGVHLGTAETWTAGEKDGEKDGGEQKKQFFFIIITVLLCQ